MPIEKKCPTCSRRMIRLYRRDHGSSRSKYFGIVWMCPDNHMIFNDSGVVFVPQSTD